MTDFYGHVRYFDHVGAYSVHFVIVRAARLDLPRPELIGFGFFRPVLHFTFHSQNCFLLFSQHNYCLCDKDEESDADPLNTTKPEEESSEDEEEKESFLPVFGSQEETQVQSNKSKSRSSGGKLAKKHRHSGDARTYHSKDSQHSQRGVLSEQAAKNRQNRRVENSENMSGAAGNRTSRKELEAAIRKLQQEMEENNRQHQLELAMATKSAQKSKKNRASSTGFGSQVPVSTELDERVAEVAGTDLWRTCKFLADESQVDEACEMVMKLIPEVADLVDPENADKEVNIQAFNEHYGETICRTINVKRGDVQSGLKKAYQARAAANLSMPTPKELGQVIRRVDLEYDPEDPEKNAQNREWFLWYWEHLLSKVSGKANWGHNIRCYGTISKHAPPDDPKKKYITSSDEALVLLLYENCGQRFPYTAECAAKGVSADKTHKRYQSRWSSARAGQCKFGGWNLEGRKRYIELRSKISKAKRKNHVEAVETFTLKELQAKHNIGTKTAAKKKGVEPKDFEGKEEGFASFGVESDDETQGQEEEDEESSDFEDLEEVYQAPPPKKARNA